MKKKSRKKKSKELKVIWEYDKDIPEGKSDMSGSELAAIVNGKEWD